MSVGSGLAIAGIWAAVAVLGLRDPVVGLLAAIVAMFATAVVVLP